MAYERRHRSSRSRRHHRYRRDDNDMAAPEKYIEQRDVDDDLPTILKESPKKLFAEFLGTLLLTFAIVASRGTADAAGAPAGGLVGVALTHAFVLASLAAAFGGISGGHFNPAVTFGFMCTGEIHFVLGFLYWCMQIGGGIVGGLIAGEIVPAQNIFWAAPNFYTTVSMDPLSDAFLDSDEFTTASLQAFGAEFIGTFLLVLVIFLAAVSGAASHSAFMAIGFALGVGVLMIGPVSNACLNPARAMGAAVAAGDLYSWAQFWPYIAGPLAGGLVASLLYGFIYQTAEDASKGPSIRCWDNEAPKKKKVVAE